MITPAEFSREIEAYLCRKNEGHLIRIVGPAFDKVCGWAKQGVPLRVAFQGIDRYFERRLAKGPAANRRPARVEFCEADVLDAFDAWRRAVGVMPGAIVGADDPVEADGGTYADSGANAGRGVDGRIGADAGSAAGAGAHAAETGDARMRRSAATGSRGSAAGTSGTAAGGHRAAADAPLDPETAGDDASSERAAARRKTGLQTHIDRVMARLTQRRVDSGVSSALGEAIDRLLGDLDVLRAGAKGVRQEARAEIVSRLRALDDVLIASARTSMEPSLWQSAERDAREELEPFRSRMDPAAYAAALHAATARTFRALARLPSVAVEE